MLKISKSGRIYTSTSSLQELLSELISAFNILYWNYPPKLGLHLKWTGQGRGAKIRVHSKEQPTAAGHFFPGRRFLAKETRQNLNPSLLGGQLPFFGWSKPVKTNNNITLILSYKLIEKMKYFQVIKSFVISLKKWELLSCSLFDANFCKLAYSGICMPLSKPIAMHCHKCRNTAINQIVLGKLCKA